MTYLWSLISQDPQRDQIRSESLCVYRKPHPLDDYIESIIRLPKTPLKIKVIF